MTGSRSTERDLERLAQTTQPLEHRQKPVWWHARKVRTDRDQEENATMLLQSDRPWLAAEQIGDITVVKFNLPEVLDEDTIQTISEQLFHLAEHAKGLRLVLNLDAVERLSAR